MFPNLNVLNLGAVRTGETYLRLELSFPGHDDKLKRIEHQTLVISVSFVFDRSSILLMYVLVSF